MNGYSTNIVNARSLRSYFHCISVYIPLLYGNPEKDVLLKWDILDNGQ